MTRACFTLLAALLIAPPAVAQQPGRPNAPNANTPAPPPGTSILRGHVTAAETGKPLRRAQVRITAGEIRENRLTTTDENGKFEFTEVRAGRYNIEASKGGYVAATFGQQRPTDAGRPLQILDNQTVERLDFALGPGCIVTGRIVDELRRADVARHDRRAAVYVRPGPAATGLDGAFGLDRRSRRVQIIRRPAGPVLPDGDVAAPRCGTGERGQDGLRHDVLSRHGQSVGREALHARQRPADRQPRDGDEADESGKDHRHRDEVGRLADDRHAGWRCCRRAAPFS